MANDSGVESLVDHPPEGTNRLRDILNNDNWKKLTSNYNSIDHLLPKDITENNLNSLLDLFANETLKVRGDGPAPRVIEGLGTITFVGNGESKNAYLLANAIGKKLVVLFYAGSTSKYSEKPFIPDDPKIRITGEYTMSSYPGETFHNAEYSDFRTYLSIPVISNGERRGAMVLQEYGGSSYPKDQLTKEKEKKMKKRVFKYITKRGYITNGEEFFGRHYLDAGKTNGPPHVIDIPIDDYHRGDLQRYIHDQVSYHRNPFYSVVAESNGILTTIRRKLGTRE